MGSEQNVEIEIISVTRKAVKDTFPSGNGYVSIALQYVGASTKFYIIRYRPYSSSVGWKEVGVKATERGFVLAGLAVDTEYEIKVYIFLENGEEDLIRTVKRIPAKETFQSGSRYVSISWPNVDALPKYYVIKYRPKTLSVGWKEVAVPATETGYVLGGLVMGIEYAITVYSFSGKEEEISVTRKAVKDTFPSGNGYVSIALQYVGASTKFYIIRYRPYSSSVGWKEVG